MEGEKKRVAIACQGGGSHTAFTAGALKRLLRDDRYEVVALSGTSGGAICALLAWYALLENGGEGAAVRAARLLDSFWQDNSARALRQILERLDPLGKQVAGHRRYASGQPLQHATVLLRPGAAAQDAGNVGQVR
jgi:predicted acylesterase/phospholipase RssA